MSVGKIFKIISLVSQNLQPKNNDVKIRNGGHKSAATEKEVEPVVCRNKPLRSYSNALRSRQAAQSEETPEKQRQREKNKERWIREKKERERKMREGKERESERENGRRIKRRGWRGKRETLSEEQWPSPAAFRLCSESLVMDNGSKRLGVGKENMDKDIRREAQKRC